MPSIIINDTLQDYSPGTGFPTGFTQVGPIFTNRFIDFNSGRPPTPSPGFYERQGIGYALFGAIQYPLNNLVASTVVQSMSVFWSTWGFGNVRLCSVDPTNANNVNTLLSFGLELDYSITAIVPGNRQNALQQVYWENTWQFFQLNASFGSTTIGGIVYLTVNFTLVVNGIIVFNNATLITTLPLSQLWDDAADMNAWQFWSSNFGSYFGEFTIYDGQTIIPFYPNESAIINSHISQMVMETVQMPLNNMRVSQVVVETIQKPSLRNIRMSQAVVEIVLNGPLPNNPSGGNDVRVREA